MHNFKKKPWFIPTLLTIVILTVGGLYIASLINKKEPIAADQIRTQLENMYGGTVDQIAIEGNVYKADMTRSGAKYSAEINAVTGNVLSITQTSEVIEKTPEPHMLSEADVKEVLSKKYAGTAEQITLNTKGKSPVYEVKLSKDPKFTNVTVDATTGTITSEVVKETTGQDALITQEQAIKIALGQLKKVEIEEVDDVSYEKSEDGGYYLIEIDTMDDREVTFIIHAISGKVMSQTWEEG
ncbi:PepSY domain-containing protein [Sporosarcina sp. NPDC096371]|uniref:PepSY domain-containing protein n=1 Tax=Sporosarcina sp. NPDC096371 TaxID=3364530 RepID=UPI00381BF680